MLATKAAVFISHSERFKAEVAIPLKQFAESLDMVPILVSEMPSPEQASTEPDAKVDYYLDKADMFVALLTPDEKLDSGVVHTRHNITDELSRARERRHLRGRVQVFKESQVELHSNITPTYETLDLSDVSSMFPCVAPRICRETGPGRRRTASFEPFSGRARFIKCRNLTANSCPRDLESLVSMVRA